MCKQLMDPEFLNLSAHIYIYLSKSKLCLPMDARMGFTSTAVLYDVPLDRDRCVWEPGCPREAHARGRDAASEESRRLSPITMTRTGALR